MSHTNIPTPPTLDHAPQLAVLAVLDTAITAATFALIAAHPPLRESGDAIRPGDGSYLDAAARAVINCAHLLDDALENYRAAVQRDAERQQQFPF